MGVAERGDGGVLGGGEVEREKAEGEVGDERARVSGLGEG